MAADGSRDKLEASIHRQVNRHTINIHLFNCLCMYMDINLQKKMEDREREKRVRESERELS